MPNMDLPSWTRVRGPRWPIYRPSLGYQKLREGGIARGLWLKPSPSDSKGKKPSGGQRPSYVGTINLVGLRPPRHYQTIGKTSRAYYLHCYVQYRPPRSLTPTYLHPTLEPVLLHKSERDLPPYTLDPKPHRLLFFSYRDRHDSSPS
ncbi:hypothetical protein CK203_052413 [Vitis vinifera]|uniref:Uncharacterized protein n=1 Tax=Vitis vinifera TaxID=29760 RepID=A0A438H6Q4_VITVI|nr:hypothetical protein CK203_052413 [Vitis vinifera]